MIIYIYIYNPLDRMPSFCIAHLCTQSVVVKYVHKICKLLGTSKSCCSHNRKGNLGGWLVIKHAIYSTVYRRILQCSSAWRQKDWISWQRAKSIVAARDSLWIYKEVEETAAIDAVD